LGLALGKLRLQYRAMAEQVWHFRHQAPILGGRLWA
jgi:hypothetical protein